MKICLVSQNYDETVAIGASLATTLQSGDVVALDGDLGAGKTVFAKGIASIIAPEAFVSSPTFTIVNEYVGQANKFPLYHFDTYRLTGVEDFLNSGLEEYLYSDGICVIEWCSIIEDILGVKTLKVQILGTGDTRRINIEFDEEAISKERAIRITKALEAFAS